MLRSTPQLIASQMSTTNPFEQIQKRTSKLESEFQMLLDGQSACLLRYYEEEQNGSGDGSLQQRQKQNQGEKKVSLSAARHGISRNINAMAVLKREEEKLLCEQLQSRENAITALNKHAKRTTELTADITSINSGSGHKALSDLNKEVLSTEATIRDLELQLQEKKAHRERLLSLVGKEEKAAQARLATKKASLRDEQQSLERYIHSSPIQPLAIISSCPPPFYVLNPSERTLEIAEEQWSTEHSKLSHLLQRTRAEIAALDEGAILWQQSLQLILGFEKRLSEELRLENKDPVEYYSPTNSDRRNKILEELNSSTTKLAHFYRVAETRGWKLLVCCIGTEVEMFHVATPKLVGSLAPQEVQNSKPMSKTLPPRFRNENASEGGFASGHQDAIGDKTIQKSPLISHGDDEGDRLDTGSPSTGSKIRNIHEGGLPHAMSDYMSFREDKNATPRPAHPDWLKAKRSSKNAAYDDGVLLLDTEAIPGRHHQLSANTGDNIDLLDQNNTTPKPIMNKEKAPEQAKQTPATTHLNSSSNDTPNHT